MSHIDYFINFLSPNLDCKPHRGKIFSALPLYQAWQA